MVLVWGSFLRVRSGCLPRLQLSECLAGAGGSSSKVAPIRGWWIVPGCWKNTSVPCHMGFFMWLAVYPYTRVDGLTKSEWYKRERLNLQGLLCPSFWSHAPSWPRHPKGCTGQPCSALGPCWGVNTRRQESCRSMWRLAAGLIFHFPVQTSHSSWHFTSLGLWCIGFCWEFILGL